MYVYFGMCFPCVIVFAICVRIACWQFSVGRVLTGAVLESYALAEFSVGRVPVLQSSVLVEFSVGRNSSVVCVFAEFQCCRVPVLAEF